MKKNSAIIVLWFVFVLPIFSQQKSLPQIEAIRGNIQDWFNDVYLTASEDVLIGVGVGELNTMESSMEQAKFNAHADICRQLSMHIRNVKNSIDYVPQDIVDRLDFYQNRYYDMVSLEVSYQACFMLYGLTTVERRSRTSDGKIWYVVSFNKNKTGEIVGLDEYIRNYFNSSIEEFEGE
jgi:hypothetical protein